MASMDLTLTWDLLLILFFGIVIAYSFIVGKEESAKIIIASYVAAIAVQGIGNLGDLLTQQTSVVADILGFTVSSNIMTSVKLILFTIIIIVLAVRGGLQIDYEKTFPGWADLLITTVYGIATGGLLLCILITYVAQAPILSTTIGQSPSIAPLLSQSQLVQVMVDYQNVWFALPAILLLGIGLWSKKG
jgi:hypothetical protein